MYCVIDLELTMSNCVYILCYKVEFSRNNNNKNHICYIVQTTLLFSFIQKDSRH